MDESREQSKLNSFQESTKERIDSDSLQSLSLEDVALELCVKLAFVDDLIERNILNSVCMEGLTLVSKEDLNNYKSISHVSNRETDKMIRQNEEVSLCWPAQIEEDYNKLYGPLIDQSSE